MSKNEDILLMEIKRIHRRYGSSIAPKMIAAYVTERYYPKSMCNGRRKPTANATVDKIKEAATSYFGISWETLIIRNRQKELVYARKVMIWLLIVRTQMSLKSIGRMFLKDHSSIIHLRDSMKGLIEKDPNVRQEVEYLNSQL